MAHILIAGLGDLGRPLAETLSATGHRISGIRRGRQAPPGVDLYSQDLLDDSPVLLPPEQVDLLYIIFTPAERTEAGYHRAFLEMPARLLDELARQQPMPPLVFVSSTAVYGSDAGEASEETAPAPDRFNGRILLAAEEEISTRSVATTVRFSGIYGPGRLSQLRRVRAIAEQDDAPPPARFTNRIHSQDCVSLLAHLGERWLAGEMAPPLVLGTDNTPVINLEVLNWLGEQTGYPLDLPVPDIAPGKRLHSNYIGQGNHSLRYPDFRSGYRQVLEG